MERSTNERRIKFHRLKDLRVQQELSQAEVAKILGVQRVVYRRWEHGDREVPAWVLNSLADFYETSIDYLMLRTDSKFAYPESEYKRRTEKPNFSLKQMKVDLAEKKATEKEYIRDKQKDIILE